MPKRRDYKKCNQKSADETVESKASQETQEQESRASSSFSSVIEPVSELVEQTKSLDLNKTVPKDEASIASNLNAKQPKSIPTGVLKTNPSGSKGRKTQVKANFYEMNIDFSKGGYQYDVDIECHFLNKSGGKGEFNVKKEQKRELIERAISVPYAFDGEKILFTTESIKLEYEIRLKNEHVDREEIYKIKLQQTGYINLIEMENYIKNKTLEAPLTGINLLDVVYRQNLIKTHAFFKRSLFNIDENGKDLGQGLCFFSGHYQSIKACDKGYFQNFDISSSVFYKPISLTDFLKETQKDINLNALLNEEQLKAFERNIRGLMVSPTHLKINRNFKVISVGVSADKYEFELNIQSDSSAKSSEDLNNNPVKTEAKTRKITVADYFKESNQIKLKYPHLPCIEYGDKKNPKAFPIEVCFLAKGQRYLKPLQPSIQSKLVQETVFKPDERACRIQNIVDVNEKQTNSSLLKKIGILTNPNRSMTTVDARILDQPKTLNKPFTYFKPVPIEKWICIWMHEDANNRKERNELIRNKFICGVKNTFSKTLTIKSQPVIQVLSKQTVDEIFDLINKNCPNPNLVIFIIEDSEEEYARIKSLGDLKFGIPTQCINYSKLVSKIDLRIPLEETKDDRNLDMYLSNVALKINAKLGGINSVVNLSLDGINLYNESCMMMGGDVTNFGNGKSIASLVGSCDKHFTQYFSFSKYQENQNKNKKSQEIIVDMEDMTFDILNSYMQQNKTLPKRIVYFRDGVDTGQFMDVIEKEQNDIKKAYEKLSGGKTQPKITVLIVVKRHHTKLFPIYDNDKIDKFKNPNLGPGALIDSGIMTKNPNVKHSFYLISHRAIKGTTKPILYHLIHDENNFSIDDIQSLTYGLCYIYASSKNSVSIPAPVYYAHNAAERSRIYNDDDDDDDDENDEENDTNLLNEVKTRIINLHKNIQMKMTFV